MSRLGNDVMYVVLIARCWMGRAKIVDTRILFSLDRPLQGAWTKPRCKCVLLP